MTRADPGVPRRCLVTGGAGFIGSHLVDRLVASGARVVVLDNLSTGRRENIAHHGDRVEMITGDVRRVAELTAGLGRFDQVYHLAAAVGVGLVLDDPIGSIETNVEGTAAVLRWAERAGAPPVLVASSSEVYGKPGTQVFNEQDDSLYGPTSVTRWSYAAAKALDEHLALAYARTRGVPTVTVRLFNTVGPRQVGAYGMVLPRFVEAALAGRPLRVFGDGQQTRCFCDARDVVRAMAALMDGPAASGEVFNLGSDHPITIRSLADLVVRTLGSGSQIEPVPYDRAYAPGFEDLRHRRPDLTRIRGVIGFRPEYTLEQTIRDLASCLAK